MLLTIAQGEAMGPQCHSQMLGGSIAYVTGNRTALSPLSRLGPVMLDAWNGGGLPSPEMKARDPHPLSGSLESRCFPAASLKFLL